jgi:prepilin-type N-terminal cleavage/methylation domain-containing protein/prepilin-type processing-associated H-X9-DG protein
MRGNGLRSGKGFTLIELLVVIAIIAILAAILFPVFLRAKAASQNAKCASNLRQLGVAFRAYLDDWFCIVPPAADGYIVWKTPGAGSAYVPNAIGWTERLWAYHHKVQIYKCPARRVNFGYSYNGNLGLDAQRRQASASPRRPGKLIVIFDAPGSGSGFINPNGPNDFSTGNADQTNEGQTAPRQIGPDETFESYQWLVPKPSGIGSGAKDQLHSQFFLPGPHSGRLNILMWDGHVQSVGTWVAGAMYLDPLMK